MFRVDNHKRLILVGVLRAFTYALLIRLSPHQGWDGLLQNYGQPELPDDLTQIPSMARATPLEKHVWKLFDDKGNEVTIDHRPRYITTDMLALREALFKVWVLSSYQYSC
ncbi:MAG: hypothetical protein ACOH5I_02440 [Oligoflexus sp.]